MIGSRHFKFHDFELVDKLIYELLDFLFILRNLEISNERNGSTTGCQIGLVKTVPYLMFPSGSSRV
jgi:hypothetical protein